MIQKSTREGFGLTVTEAMWKAKAVIGGNVGGIRIQIEDGVSGYLVNSSEECAQQLVPLLQDPQLRTRLGDAAQASVRERFLMPRLAFEYLQVAQSHASIVDAADATVGANGAAARDGLHTDAADVPDLVAEKVAVRVRRQPPTQT